METANIRLEKRPPLAIVTIDRPKVLNALNAETLTELEAAFDELAVDPDMRVLLLIGAGDRAFAAGADIRELAPLSPEEGRAFALRGQGIFRKLKPWASP